MRQRGDGKPASAKLSSFAAEARIDRHRCLVYFDLAFAPVAQLDRASASGAEGLAFESRRVYRLSELKGLPDSQEKGRPFVTYSFEEIKNPSCLDFIHLSRAS